MSLVLGNIEIINLKTPDYEGPWISGEERWMLILEGYKESPAVNFFFDKTD